METPVPGGFGSSSNIKEGTSEYYHSPDVKTAATGLFQNARHTYENPSRPRASLSDCRRFDFKFSHDTSREMTLQQQSSGHHVVYRKVFASWGTKEN
jgi:hypothetical protein